VPDQTAVGTRGNATARINGGIERVLLVILVGLGGWGLLSLHSLGSRIAVMEKWMELESAHSGSMDHLLAETVQKWAEGQIDVAKLAAEMRAIRQTMRRLEREHMTVDKDY